MRHLILMRGLPGSGKSTWIKSHKLEQYAIEPDNIRMLLSSPIMDKTGKFGINQGNDKRVWEMVYQLVEDRMDRGETIIVDATHKKTSDFAVYTKLAEKYLYRVGCVDFSKLPLEDCIRRNYQREEHKQVPEEVIRKQHADIIKSNVPKSVYVIDPTRWMLSPHSDDVVLDAFLTENDPEFNLSAFERIHHIGDVQGCFEPLKEYFKDGFNPNHYYIFTGDFLDRGIQNGEVMRWVLDVAINQPNTVFIQGNHERHLVHWVADTECRSNEFLHNTLPQLIEHGVTKNEVRRYVHKLKDFFMYRYGPERVFVSHAGIGKVPSNIHLLTAKQLWNGVGAYGEPIDKIFTEQNPGWIQVHGHRNTKCLPIDAAVNPANGSMSFNLEGQVEFGGTMKVVSFGLTKANGDVEITVQCQDIPNPVFKGFKERLKTSHSEWEDPTTTPWFVADDAFTNKMSDKLFDELSKHELVRAKSSTLYPNVTSFSFTRKAFYDKAWDAINIKARGLFVNSETKEIVARSYEKFFNMDENEQHQRRSLENRLVFPVEVYIKENGFLGIVGYDKESDALFITSKGTPEGEFADNFRRIFTNKFPKSQQDIIKRLLRDQEACLVFEVIDPINDPHMIKYEQDDLILLDIVARSETFKKATYDQMKTFANKFNLKYKQRFAKFESWEKLNGWLNNITKDESITITTETIGDYINKIPKQVEGYVIEDSAGFMFKVKCPFYSFWKYMRSMKDRKAASIEKGTKYIKMLRESNELGKAFLNYIENKDLAYLQKDIISIREDFLCEEVVKQFLISSIDLLQTAREDMKEKYPNLLD